MHEIDLAFAAIEINMIMEWIYKGDDGAEKKTFVAMGARISLRRNMIVIAQHSYSKINFPASPRCEIFQGKDRRTCENELVGSRGCDCRSDGSIQPDWESRIWQNHRQKFISGELKGCKLSEWRIVICFFLCILQNKIKEWTFQSNDMTKLMTEQLEHIMEHGTLNEKFVETFKEHAERYEMTRVGTCMIEI